jgi:hypothetical protein
MINRRRAAWSETSGQIRNVGKSFSLGKCRGPDTQVSRRATPDLARGCGVAIEAKDNPTSLGRRDNR